MEKRNKNIRTLIFVCLQLFLRRNRDFVSHYMIFGKDDCPHTQKAITDFKDKHRSFIYINVDKDPHGLKKLLEYSNDQYIVPVIVNVDEDSVEIGYTGE